ncbi:MAG: hypothetical protein IKJ69_05390 [Clostridia bacterium]|nr:hypothetical protein [Clostridia bacterium]
MNFSDELKQRTSNSGTYQSNIQTEKQKHFMESRDRYIERVCDYIYQQTKLFCRNAANEGKRECSFYPYIVREWSDVCSNKIRVTFKYLSSWESWKDKAVLPYDKYDKFEIFGKESTTDQKDSWLDAADSQDIINCVSKKFDNDGLSYDICFEKKKFSKKLFDRTMQYELHIRVRW